MRRFIIGDIRGDLPLLKKMMDKLCPSNADFVLFLGSYLGPGPDSKGVIDYLLDLYDKDLDVHFLKGCYEFMFQYCTQEDVPMQAAMVWSQMKGNNVFKSYASNKSLYVLHTGINGRPEPTKVEIPMVIPERHIRFMNNLHQWFEDETFPIVACHAGGHPALYGGTLETEEQAMFGETNWWKQDWRQIPGKTVVFSHVPFDQPFLGKGKIGIDLGAGIGGKLCAYEMATEQITIVG
jgi:serine/threonine protein phosphatase 1